MNNKSSEAINTILSLGIVTTFMAVVAKVAFPDESDQIASVVRKKIGDYLPDLKEKDVPYYSDQITGYRENVNPEVADKCLAASENGFLTKYLGDINPEIRLRTELSCLEDAIEYNGPDNH